MCTLVFLVTKWLYMMMIAVWKEKKKEKHN